MRASPQFHELCKHVIVTALLYFSIADVYFLTAPLRHSVPFTNDVVRGPIVINAEGTCRVAYCVWLIIDELQSCFLPKRCVAIIIGSTKMIGGNWTWHGTPPTATSRLFWADCGCDSRALAREGTWGNVEKRRAFLGLWKRLGTKGRFAGQMTSKLPEARRRSIANVISMG